MRERVVDHQVIDVLVRDPGLLERRRSGHAERARRGEILHLADHRRFRAFAGAQDIDRLGREILRALGRGQDQRAAAVGHQAAHQQPERIGDHAAVQHVVGGDRIAERRPRVLRRPFALHDGNLGDLLLGHAVGLHVAQHRDGEHATAAPSARTAARTGRSATADAPNAAGCRSGICRIRHA